MNNSERFKETDNTLALKYFDQFKAEIIEHEATRQESERRLKYNQFLLVENAQLARELKALREEFVICA